MFKTGGHTKILFSFTLNLAWFLFIISWLFIVMDVLLQYEKSPLTLSQWALFFLHKRLPLQLPLIAYIGTRIKSNRWQTMFDWHVWIIPASMLLSLSILSWQFNPALIHSTGLLGLKWNWAAIFQWNILFILQLYLYQKYGTQPFIAFTLSYLGVFLGSFLYEIPFFIKTGGIYNHTFLITYIISFAVFLWLLPKQKFKLKIWHFTLFIPLTFVWLFYFALPMELHRLSVFPLFLSLSMTKRTAISGQKK